MRGRGHMRRRSWALAPYALVAALATTAPESSWARNFQQCFWANGTHHAVEVEHVDHGRGIVSYINGFGFPGGERGQTLYLVSCTEQTQVRVSLRFESDVPEGDRGYAPPNHDSMDLVLARFEELLRDDDEYTLREVAEELSELSPASRFSELSRQPCSCWVAYPTYRGFENPFDDRYILRN